MADITSCGDGLAGISEIRTELKNGNHAAMRYYERRLTQRQAATRFRTVHHRVFERKKLPVYFLWRTRN